MEDLWTKRDLVVLRFLVDHFDDPRAHGSGLDIAGPTGLPPKTVDRALARLNRAEPPYLEVIGGAEDYGIPLRVTGVTERAYRDAGA